jgi:peptide/nickel transport system permease protein
VIVVGTRIASETTIGSPVRARAGRRIKGLGRQFHGQPVGVVSALILIVILLMAVLAPWITPYDPIKNSTGGLREAPSLSNWLGTDQLGRDVFSRTLAGSRISILVGFLTVVLCITVGTSLGLVAGYRGGRTDQAISWLVDLSLTLPGLVLAMVVATALGRSIIAVTFAIALIETPQVARLVRSTVFSVKETDYVMAARAVGASNLRIALRHVLPQTFVPVIVMASVIFPNAIIIEASLSFLGMGVPPPAPSWGRIIAESRDYLSVAPWIALGPAVVLGITIFSANMLGDTLRDILDPRLRGTLAR